jgi:hypothetical protein
MTHDEAKSQISALFEQRPHEVQHVALREHLAGCADCRAVYDRMAMTVRRLSGRPDEMSPEELSLFTPPLPPAKVVPLFRTGPLVGLALAAGLAAVVLYFAVPRNAVHGDDGFTPRGNGTPRAAVPTLRVLCAHEGKLGPLDTCVDGDKLLFAVTPRGRAQVGLLVDGALVGAMATEPNGSDEPLPWSATFHTGVKVQAVFASTPVDAAAALSCAKGTCGAGLEAVMPSP